ncbi:glutamine-hydrolyzing GMP synthase [Suttonella ornithocola]|uniref:GMP synthase [glutamine-hydrolyzing] n=1 Tax=Suttonella ornithocola TaxID=279832 RepID=A0A380MRP4_9GAMM|nr:glutamine-hydrolyzing GMP synthase [Suttonella ornithocola]SUO94982.1 GMP synthase [glutamine-hydrolyzing] [Suttonella ornithocola]
MSGQDLHHHKILILDFGSQVTQLIARRVREAGVYSEIYAWDADAQAIEDFAANGIILSGGPESTTVEGSPSIPKVVFELGVPILGICYGMQALAKQFGGKVENTGKQEFGYAEMNYEANSPLFKGLDMGEVWMSHGDHVSEIPVGFERIASSENAPIAAFANNSRRIYGVQFHPEVTHTPNGGAMIAQFVREICGCTANWTTDKFIEENVAAIREQIGQDRVVLALSGGVDSSVVAALLHEAIGEQLTCVFVDTGLLRLNEGDEVMKTFADNMGVNVIRVNAAERYFSALKGVTDPEEKRKIIGRLFVEIFDEEATKIDGVKWLAQGTIYPDVIESAGSKTGKAHVIKSHHNVGGLPENMTLKLLEPLRELFKDEVRTLGIALGLPPAMLYRHPFPGPGLGVRILGEVKAEYAELLRRADDIFIRKLREYDLYDKVSQAFAVFLPVRSVGVMGDGRRYDYVIALRAVETVDFMSARWAHLPYDFLDEVSRGIINGINGISRVVYDISGKPPATIEWE